jgi:hypothetical protein
MDYPFFRVKNEFAAKKGATHRFSCYKSKIKTVQQEVTG